jgi:hypothetical protein
MQIDQIVFREPQKEEIGQIVELFASNDPSRRDLFTSHYYHWQFDSIPAGCKQLVACHQNKIVGFGALLTFQGVVHGEKQIVYEGVEFVVKPEYRGKGIFSYLSKTLYESIGSCPTFAFASSMSFPIYTSKLGHGFSGNAWYWIGIVDVRSLLSRKIGFLAKILNPFSEKIELKDFSSDEVDLEKLTRFGKEWDAVADWNTNSGFSLVKDSDFLNWRYADHPYYTYDILGIKRCGMPEGLIVLRDQNIVDICYANADALRSLLAAAQRYFKKNKVLICHLFSWIDKEGVKMLRSMNFIKVNALQAKITQRYLYPPQRCVIRGFDRMEKNAWKIMTGDIDCKM